MPLRKWLTALAVTTASVGLVIPTSCLQAQQPRESRQPGTALDVALGDDGALTGFVVDDSGQPRAAFPIQLQRLDAGVIDAVSNERGQFRCQLQDGGMYLLAAGDQCRVLRCWAPGTAPPNARSQVVVQANDVVRGQISPASSGLGNPWVITGLAVAAIVIPVALHNNRADRDAGS